MRDVLNATVKKREPFRPFAPAVLVERVGGVLRDRPARPVHDAGAAGAPRQGARSSRAAVHVDGTARIQTVERAANPRYYGLIEEFGRLTGVPVLLNTSFNRSEPIVASPTDAVSCFLNTGMDVLAIGDFLATAPRR